MRRLNLSCFFATQLGFVKHFGQDVQVVPHASQKSLDSFWLSAYVYLMCPTETKWLDERSGPNGGKAQVKLSVNKKIYANIYSIKGIGSWQKGDYNALS